MTTYERKAPRPRRRVVITGLGAISSLGTSAAELWKRLLAGESGIRTAANLDPAIINCTVRGDVDDETVPNRFLDAKTLRLLRKANGASGGRPKPQRRQLAKGSKLFREWHGETHEVLVLDKGFTWRGETYSSLSAIARAITRAHWNGWAFFGLKRPTKEAPTNG